MFAKSRRPVKKNTMFVPQEKEGDGLVDILKSPAVQKTLKETVSTIGAKAAHELGNLALDKVFDYAGVDPNQNTKSKKKTAPQPQPTKQNNDSIGVSEGSSAFDVFRKIVGLSNKKETADDIIKKLTTKEQRKGSGLKIL